MIRALHQVDLDVLTTLLAILPAGDEPAEGLRERARRVQASPDLAAKVQQALDEVLDAPPWGPLETLEDRLQIARRRGDPAALAGMLWHAARRHGPAWRRLEARAHQALLDLALRRLAPSPAAVPAALPTADERLLAAK